MNIFLTPELRKLRCILRVYQKYLATIFTGYECLNNNKIVHFPLLTWLSMCTKQLVAFTCVFKFYADVVSKVIPPYNPFGNNYSHILNSLKTSCLKHLSWTRKNMGKKNLKFNHPKVLWQISWSVTPPCLNWSFLVYSIGQKNISVTSN